MSGAGHTRELADLRSADAGRFGGKSAALGELIGAGIPVPGGFALPAELYTAAVAPLAIDESAPDPGAIRAAIVDLEIPDEIVAEIEQRYAGLADGEPPVAVRSSALGEDSEEATFAGQQETILWVRGTDALLDAIRRCWASLFSNEAISYRRHLGTGAGAPAMGVTVQRMVDAAVSGVLFTCNPVTGDRSMVAINASWGLGLAVVGGEVTPDDHLVSKVTGEVVRETIADKAVQYVARPDGRGTECVAVTDAQRSERCLDAERLAALVAVGARVEKHFGSPQDVEWAIDSAGELFVLQARPVTGLPERPPTARPASAMDMVMGMFGANRGGRGVMGLTDDDIREILRIVDESELDELRIDTETFSLHVLRGGAEASAGAAAAQRHRAAPAPAPAPAPVAEPSAQAPPDAAEASAPDDGTVVVPSPMLGTFYLAEAPGATPFIEVGATVDAETTICIIEVMKMMNSVSAGVSGTVVEVCAENGALVEYGEPLIRVKTA